ncbi:hypothetical protein DPX16_8536 [Anabarilius grahami]|uniref:Uncharacterized protein n=1 Tax=Anabarilius grahami TaxID=495550 RepID=A0A3N0YAG0_ANAGA|nr:hypothetical protein DPX16_8536 [Anabarilius grahami]
MDHELESLPTMEPEPTTVLLHPSQGQSLPPAPSCQLVPSSLLVPSSSLVPPSWLVPHNSSIPPSPLASSSTLAPPLASQSPAWLCNVDFLASPQVSRPMALLSLSAHRLHTLMAPPWSISPPLGFLILQASPWSLIALANSLASPGSSGRVSALYPFIGLLRLSLSSPHLHLGPLVYCPPFFLAPPPSVIPQVLPGPSAKAPPYVGSIVGSSSSCFSSSLSISSSDSTSKIPTLPPLLN